MRFSAHTIGHAQADGRRYVVFSFVLDSGKEAVIERGPMGDSVDFDEVRERIGGEIEAAVEMQSALEQEQVEQQVAQEKIAGVLAAAVAKGELTSGDLDKAGLPVSMKSSGEVGEAIV